MPIKPTSSETEEEFIGRCMSEEVPTYGTEQGYAICKSKWELDNMSKLSSPQDRVNAKFNSIRIKHSLIEKFEVQPTISSTYPGQGPTTSSLQEICPPATTDIALNLKNRKKAIDVAKYGPLNPNEPNEEYWEQKAEEFHSGDIQSAKKALCGNCVFFDITKSVLSCIEKGIGGPYPFDIIEAGQIGYCEAFDFKCAAERTCDAWVVGGPIKD
jgi:hypothetical protein